ncbi:MAG: PDZ domain-containing protein [Candidatus Obscuribacterales bacterium]|nr:PDZ domain-containing protein [Candidatus Obscuribacterales bacterium]
MTNNFFKRFEASVVKRRALGPGLMLLLVLMVYTSTNWTLAEEPILKPDIPKFDLTVPKSKTLKGGVLHQEAAASAQSAPLKKMHSGVLDIFKKKQDKLKAQTAKSTADSALKSGASVNPLDSMIERGVGIIGVKFVLPTGRMPIINRVFPGTPAWQVGLRSQDIIVAVDGVPTLGLAQQDVYAMITGKPDTNVTISIRRSGNFIAKTMKRMDFNDIPDPLVRQDYLLSI